MEEKLSKSPTIQTDYLKIFGNALEFEDTTLQLSNISLLSTKDIAPARFPGWSVVLILIGVLLWQRSVALSLLMIGAGAIWICLWYSKKQEMADLKKLIIITNSGNAFPIIFNDQAFLKQVVDVLNSIIANPTSHGNITINVKDNVLQGDASVIQTLNDFSPARKE